MCACEAGFTCSRCRGTRFDPRYLELPDREDEDKRDTSGDSPDTEVRLGE